MSNDARSTPSRSTSAAILIAMLLALAAMAGPARAQMGPVRHNGFVEYQYRLDNGRAATTNSTQLATWRGNFATYMWRPWILQLGGDVGLTQSINSRADARQDGEIVTGGLAASLFPRSHFPFRAYVEARDSRVDGDLSDVNISTTTLGFLQQYAPRNGGRYSIELRQNEVDELYEDGSRVNRNYMSRNWLLNASNAFGRNDFRLLTQLRNLERDEPMQTEQRNSLTLRHRFRTSPRFFIEDTTFFSSETIDFDDSDLRRRFLQWNGISTWRPDTEKPLYVTLRGIAQGVDSGPSGLETGSTMMNVNGSASYQWSERITVAGNLGVTSMSADTGEDETTFSQRVRGSYRSDIRELWDSEYRWGGMLEVGNDSDRRNGGDTVQDMVIGLDHSLSRSMYVMGDRQLQFSFSQQATTAIDTADQQEFTLINGIYTTLSRQNGRTSSYLRFSLTDRRLVNGIENSFQLANLQASIRRQASRTRSWNGSITLQAGRNAQSEPGATDRENSSLSYSANLSFAQRDLFDVSMLNFMSELRWLSTDFQTDDPFDMTIGVDPKRDDRIWRNRLEYRVGRLELRLNADVRQINSDWMTQVFLQVRRYYGAL
ncbi:MAG: hypothetical protein OEW35_06705 [Gammaproteobacteria bacterium]|nr:hypothetical protein [Gammaproteobacteria bacterium]MDH4253192.1 hypothetical protein [Gammaproteobacteria bacterium]MDH5308446.1 hypothetical protein [Gammaproteobacteria bacterium]